jgi:putative nucleotidyltransferase-like protein
MISITHIRDKYTPEMALVILVCRVYLGKAPGAELREYISANKIDWPLFERIITVHQVRPLIYKALSANTALIDSVFLENLRRNCFHIATGNLQKLEELTRISRLLQDNGIRNVPYKGVILSYFLFGDFISRETADIDVLIDASDFGKTRAILSKEGYESKYYNPDFEQQFLSTSHELQFRKTSASGIIKIEVHWAATNTMMNIPLPNSLIFSDLETMKLPGGAVSIFNLQHHLLVLLVHHGVNDVWRVLRHTLDITLFLDKYQSAIDWQAFRAATIKYKVRHTTEIGFLIAEQLFGVETPAPFKSESRLPCKILDNLLTFPAIKKSKLTSANLGQQLLLRDSLADKLSVLLSYGKTGIQPNVRDMEAYPLKKHWYWLYYFIKPIRIIFGKKKIVNGTNK